MTVQKDDHRVRGSLTNDNLTFTDDAHHFSRDDYLKVLRAHGTTVTGTVTARDAVNIFGNNLASRVGVPPPLA